MGKRGGAGAHSLSGSGRAEEGLLIDAAYSPARGRGRRCVLVGGILAAATIVYFCGAALPFADETRYHFGSVRLIGGKSFDGPPQSTASVRANHLDEDERTPKPTSTPGVFHTREGSGFLVDTPGCRIPDMEPRSPAVTKYVVDEEPNPRCDKRWSPLVRKSKQRGPPLVESNLTSLWIVNSVLKYYNISYLGQLRCCYRPFWRTAQEPEKYDAKADNLYSMSQECKEFTSDGSVRVEAEDEEYVRVECSRRLQHFDEQVLNVTGTPTVEIYRDFHAFIPRKKSVEERCAKKPRRPDEVSVLVVGIDAVSRLNMVRELPRLLQVLQSDPLSSIPLLGFNKVGDNTFPNVMPLLAGLSEEELTNACPWPSPHHRLDPCPFIWKKFAAQGYRTAYGEDCTWMSAFNYAKTGFVDVPSDYYARPFLQAAEDEQGHSKRWNVKLCVGPRLALANILSYFEKFSLRFANERHFGFFWTNSVSHDFLTMPHNGDGLYAGLLARLLERGALERTVLLFISDHGIRWGGIRETYQGRMEERLPFAFLAFPKWFRERFPTAMANLRRNAHSRLTTPFDLHVTLQDLLSPDESLGSEILRDRESRLLRPESNETTSSSLPRGISLFLPIPASRECKSAHIPPHFCTCQESSVVPIDDPLVQRTVDFAVDEINSMLLPYNQCSQLTLAEVHNARKNLPLKEVGSELVASLVDTVVTFTTQPGGAVFEATVRETQPRQANLTSTLQLAGSVSRINRYGDQSRCVADFHMKLYCYCT